MQVERSKTWTISADSATVASAIEELARSRSIRVQKAGDAWQLQSGSASRMRVRGPYLTSARDMPVTGTIKMSTKQGSAEIQVHVQSEPFGAFFGSGPPLPGVKSRFERACQQLLDELERSLPAR